MTKYLTGKDYADTMCKECCAGIDAAAEILRFRGEDEYTDDPEGPSMYAYDHKWFCGGFEGCENPPDPS